MSICSDTVVKHPRFDFEIEIVDNGYPDFTGAICPQTYPDAFYYPERGDDNKMKSINFMDEGTGAWGNPYGRLYDYLADVCVNCPVLKECFNYAVVHEEWGFWGGASPAERERIRDKHNIGFVDEFDSTAMDEAILSLRMLSVDSEEDSHEYE
jgi:hypothetical protein